MIDAQIKSGHKLHLAFQAGEGYDYEHLTPAGCLSAPLCHTKGFRGRYRMNINLPLRNACKNCVARWNKLQAQPPTSGEQE